MGSLPATVCAYRYRNLRVGLTAHQRHADDGSQVWLASPVRSAPSEDGLLVSSYPFANSLDSHPSELQHDRRSRCVNGRGVEEHLDNGPIGLGDADEGRGVGALQFGERNVVDRMHLGWVGCHCRALPAPHDDGGNAVSRARDVVVEHAEHLLLGHREPKFLLEFAQGGLYRGLALIETTAREGPLAPVGPQRRGTLGEQDSRFVRLVRHHHGNGGVAKAVEVHAEALMHCEIRAERRKELGRVAHHRHTVGDRASGPTTFPRS